jgi:acyl-CoA synthetase (AMP-forming)/AMP-acid ligase II
MSLEDAAGQLCAPGARFEMMSLDLNGESVRVWKNALPDMAALVRHAADHDDQVFIIHEDDRMSYRAFVRAVSRLATHMRDLGIKRGERVALAMRNLPEWPVCFFAAASIGAICVPLNAWWSASELRFALRDSGSTAFLCDGDRWDRLAGQLDDLPDLKHVLVARASAEVCANTLETVIGRVADYERLPHAELPDVDLAADDDAAIFYTSGTTGFPKGAVATHRNLLTNILSSSFAVARAALRRGDVPPLPRRRVGLLVIPLFHVTGFSARLLGAMFNGDTLVFMHKWDPVRAFELIERERIDSAGGVPTIAWQLIEHPERHRFDLSSLETVSYGGAPAAPELVRRIKAEFGATPGSGWGMTETCATVTLHSSEDYLARPESCGPPVPVADLKIVDDAGNEVPAGQIGELWARGPMVVRGYWQNPEATAAAFTNGWVRTGDIARLDEEGFCYIVDRAKDVVIRGGENIYASEVENILFDHPAVTDAAMIGLPHRTLGEEPVAVVHLAPGADATEAELQQWVRDRLASFKVPVAIRFSMETLPRNANGKVLKSELGSYFDDVQHRTTG